MTASAPKPAPDDRPRDRPDEPSGHDDEAGREGTQADDGERTPAGSNYGDFHPDRTGADATKSDPPFTDEPDEQASLSDSPSTPGWVADVGTTNEKDDEAAEAPVPPDAGPRPREDPVR